MTTNSHVAVVLAAGQGIRMGSDLPKVAHLAAGRPMISWVLDAVTETRPARVMVVVGHGSELVRSLLPDGVESCLQESRLGTGHAVMVATEAIGDLAPTVPVMVVAGDMPTIPGSLLIRLLTEMVDKQADLAMVTAVVEDQRGFGRVVRDRHGLVVSVIEERDAGPETRAITEVNAGIYVFRWGRLLDDLGSLRPDNAQGEFYLTDVIGMTVARGGRVVAVIAAEPDVIGVNTPAQLHEAEAVLLGRRG